MFSLLLFLLVMLHFFVARAPVRITVHVYAIQLVHNRTTIYTTNGSLRSAYYGTLSAYAAHAPSSVRFVFSHASMPFRYFASGLTALLPPRTLSSCQLPPF